MPTERKLTVKMFTDITGYTASISKSESISLNKAICRYNNYWSITNDKLCNQKKPDVSDYDALFEMMHQGHLPTLIDLIRLENEKHI